MTECAWLKYTDQRSFLPYFSKVNLSILFNLLLHQLITNETIQYVLEKYVLIWKYTICIVLIPFIIQKCYEYVNCMERKIIYTFNIPNSKRYTIKEREKERKLSLCMSQNSKCQYYLANLRSRLQNRTDATIF